MKKQIRELISQNRLLEAIQKMSALDIKPKTKKSLAIIESRLHALNEKTRIGILSEENANIEFNKIRNSLLDICENIDQSTEQESSKQRLRKMLIGGIAGIALVIIALMFFSTKLTEGETCEDRKIAVLVADFQNTEKETEVDGFSNSLVVRLDNLLSDEVYDVTPVGRQSRNQRKYHDYIRKEHFESVCDTSGLFVNGFLSLDDEIFNIYMTIANLKMKVPEFSGENSIDLDNPSGIDFSIKEDATFLADFIYGIIMSYEGKPYEALNQFFELEKSEQRDVLTSDKNFKATMAHFKGNCYAMRGDNARAKSEYDIAEKYGSPELKQVSENNRQKADEVNQRMEADPEMRQVLKANLSEHSKFEVELEKFLNKIGNGLVDIFKKRK